MAAAVYFSEKFSADTVSGLFERAMADTGGRIGKKDRVAVKLHFGEEGNSRFVSPANLMPILSTLAGHNSNHFLTDANALYRGLRHNATDHLEIARKHGFGSPGGPHRHCRRRAGRRGNADRHRREDIPESPDRPPHRRGPGPRRRLSLQGPHPLRFRGGPSRTWAWDAGPGRGSSRCTLP